MARPSSYSDETASVICELLAEGESLLSILKMDGMPGRTTLYRWIDENEQFRNNYTRAREAQADHFAEQIIEIADDPTIEPDRIRGRVDARKWYTSKVAAKKYGDRSTTEHQLNGTLAFESAGLSALADFVKQALAGRTAPVIEADVSERSLLPALLCPETPGSGK
jgi:hypothetical protein